MTRYLMWMTIFKANLLALHNEKGLSWEILYNLYQSQNYRWYDFIFSAKFSYHVNVVYIPMVLMATMLEDWTWNISGWRGYDHIIYCRWSHQRFETDPCTAKDSSLKQRRHRVAYIVCPMHFNTFSIAYTQGLNVMLASISRYFWWVQSTALNTFLSV